MLHNSNVEVYTYILICFSFLKVMQPRKWWSQGNNGSNIISIMTYLCYLFFIYIYGCPKQPKCGFMPTTRYIVDGYCVKRCITWFKMHQALKLHQGKVSFIPDYFILEDKPLDMVIRQLPVIKFSLKSIPFHNIFGGRDIIYNSM